MIFLVTLVVDARFMQNLWTAMFFTKLSMNLVELLDSWLEYIASVCFCDISHLQNRATALEVVTHLIRVSLT